MKTTHAMNVRELVEGLKGISDDSNLNTISTVDETDYSILSQLDEARKCLDTTLGDSRGSVLTSSEAHIKRILYGTLRKYDKPLNLKKTGVQCTWYDFVPIQNRFGEETTCFANHLSNDDFAGLLEFNAVEGFIARNWRVQRFVPRHLISGMRRFLKQALHGFDSFYSCAAGHFGPGAVEERLSSFQRWDHMGRNPYWSPTEEDLSSGALPASDKVRLCAVDKDWNKKRLITVEPYENTYLQHKIRHALSATLTHNGLGKLASQRDSHIDIPARHRRLCLDSSTHPGQTNSIDTTDLSNASDGISWDSVISVFPLDVVAQLERARTPRYTSSVRRLSEETRELMTKDISSNIFMWDKTQIFMKGESPEVVDHELFIYAGMGNATTFLVESLYFYALLQATAEYYRIPNSRARDISVFGDDLITPTGYADLFHGSLQEAGLEINMSKSFCGTSPVRESCGMWAYKGANLYVPPYHGYSETGTGLLGLAEYIRNAPLLVRHLCVERVKDWPNVPHDYPNTVSVVDDTRPISWELCRYSSKLSGLQWYLKTAKTRDRLHLCVRRGGAYMMISRVPSQEGLSENVPLIEVLSQETSDIVRFIGHELHLRVRRYIRYIPEGKVSKKRAERLDDGYVTLFVNEGLVRFCQYIAELNRHVRKPNIDKTLRFVSRIIFRKNHILLTDEMRKVRNRFIELAKVAELDGHEDDLFVYHLLRSKVSVLKEAIPHSTTIRSSWVSKT